MTPEATDNLTNSQSPEKASEDQPIRANRRLLRVAYPSNPHTASPKTPEPSTSVQSQLAATFTARPTREIQAMMGGLELTLEEPVERQDEGKAEVERDYSHRASAPVSPDT